MSHKFYDLTFTPSVKAAQEHYGTRKKAVNPILMGLPMPRMTLSSNAMDFTLQP